MATASKPRSPAQEFAYLARLAPKEAQAYLQGKKKLTLTFSGQDLWQEEHAIQFTVSRMANMDILRAMQEGIENSVNGDLTRRDWMCDMKALLQKEGWWGKKEVTDPKTGEILTTTFDASRLKLIFDTNTRAAYSVGHWQQAVAAKASHPYLRYITKRDARVREEHGAWEGLTLPVEHEFWQTRYPPNGYRCRCRVVSVSQAEYDRGGFVTSNLPPGLQGREAGKEGERKTVFHPFKTTPPPTREITFTNRKTGMTTTVPEGVNPAFAYNVGVAGMRQAALAEAAGIKLSETPAAIGAVFGSELNTEAIAAEFAAFFDAAYENRARASGKMMVVGAMKPLWVEKASAAGVAPVSAEIAIRDKDIVHAFRDAKDTRVLPVEWLRDLPRHLKTPQAVVLDTTHKTPALLLIYDTSKNGKKLVIQVNYKVKKQGVINIVDTGQFIDASGVRAMIGNGYNLIEGEL